MKDSIVGIVLAGGTGSRLFPLTKVTNKHLLPVGRKPMIYYPIEKLIEAGITEILIVTGTEHMGDVVNLLGSGKDFGVKFTYKVQDEAGGIAQALMLAEHFARGKKMVVILGDNVFEDKLSAFMEKFMDQTRGAKVVLKKVEDPERFGVPAFGGDNKLVRIDEKPKKPASSYAVTGIYMYDDSVFEVIKTLKPSKRGELEISDVNNYYVKEGSISWDEFSGWWSDAGTFESLAKVNKLMEK
jgi:glucose-1-phosphate thymidylyltransferase